MSEMIYCRQCEQVRELEVIGENTVGRPIWLCPDEHTQAGPFPAGQEQSEVEA